MRRRADEKDLAGAGVHGADINTAQAPTSRARTAEFRGSLPDSSTAGSLMSAVWTPAACVTGSRVFAAGPDTPPGLIRPLRKVPVTLTQYRLRPEPFRVGPLHGGRDVLAKGCEYCSSPRASWSTPRPCPVAPGPRAVHARHHPNDQARCRQNEQRQSRSRNPPCRLLVMP